MTRKTRTRWVASVGDDADADVGDDARDHRATSHHRTPFGRQTATIARAASRVDARPPSSPTRLERVWHDGSRALCRGRRQREVEFSVSGGQRHPRRGRASNVTGRSLQACRGGCSRRRRRRRSRTSSTRRSRRRAGVSRRFRRRRRDGPAAAGQVAPARSRPTDARPPCATTDSRSR